MSVEGGSQAAPCMTNNLSCNGQTIFLSTVATDRITLFITNIATIQFGHWLLPIAGNYTRVRVSSEAKGPQIAVDNTQQMLENSV